ncbi:peptidase S24 [Enterobacter hormaechei]|uniref:peptidase S24 n=1 Tax=Enterobacter hormaechei TaxID=158836 RepID=UPI000659B06B|nr:peptidase S24 [Enterobacter hormaechei]KLW06527.1 hypothetical protein SK45_01614 [Enterobacter hormaechei]KLW12261.1 hypothetical protein SK46_00660 [Enterobacter hormaechei]
MQNSVAINQPVKTPQMLFGSDNINDFGNRVQSCRMEGDSMQPTIEPCEVVAFVDCGGRALTSGIYVYTMDAFGRPCLFIKRIEPLADGSLKSSLITIITKLSPLIPMNRKKSKFTVVWWLLWL